MWVYDKDTGELYHYDDELYHYGRKGMKWGQHIFGKVTATAGRAGRFIGNKIKTSAIDARNTYRYRRDRKKYQKELKTLRKKPFKSLTDDELKKAIERLNLEKDYIQLTKETSRNQVNRGRKFVVDILESSGKNIGGQLVTYLMGTGVNKIAKKIVGVEGDIVNPTKGQKDKK